LIECAADGEVMYTNPAVKKILWQQSIDISELLSVNHQDFLANAISSQLPETVVSDSGESSFLWSYQYVPETDKILIFGTDISSQKRIENQLAYDSMFDHLTGLPNRNHLLSQIRSELSVIKKRGDYTFALLLINLDRFKTIIESLGFTAGNTALKTVAKRLAKWNNNDNLVARLDGDEFAVIIEDMPNMSQIMDVANAIKLAISKDIIVKKHTIRLTESIGIAIGNTNSKSAEELLQNASAAVYRAKRQGTNHTEVYDKEMHLNALARLRVSNELNDAIDNGDLKVYYQPVFGLHDLRVRGFEALARWEHPVRGLIGPGSFISIAEDSGLIHKLGKHVIKSICAQLYKWQNDKLPLAWVSVNVSAHQFKLNHLVTDIINIITEEKADPYRLFVEITEGTAAESPERAFKMMVKLREHGIRIALDDFGTGYSSMSYLKRFPIDALKIDKSFVDGLPENQEDVAIVTSVITMAQALGMKVVAEGVEDERQAMFLRAQNCDEVQGFLYGKPMPAIKATALLRSGPFQGKKSDSKIPIGKIKLKPLTSDHNE
jgi:diguanylate cyclase (GGDEF)-like protein